MITQFFSHIHSWCSHRKGATGIEYALIATGISLAIAVVVYAFGDELRGLYDTLMGIFTG